MRVDFYQLGSTPAESVIAALAGKLLGVSLVERGTAGNVQGKLDALWRRRSTP